MRDENSSQKLMMVIGVAGIFVLLMASFSVALWKSSTPYQSDQINQVVAEQQAAADAANQ